MATRSAEAVWTGNLKEGKGSMKLGSGAFEGAFSFVTRFGDEPGTNPEELIGAALAGCFSMFLSAVLSKAGFTPTSVQTSAAVHLETIDDAPWITKIHLKCDANVPGVDEATFNEKVEFSKKMCPVSKSLAAVGEIKVSSNLTN